MPSDDITRLLAAHRAGDEAALAQLVPLVYGDLHRLARRQLGGRGSGRTLDTTALVHEAFLRLVGGGQAAWKDRGHFFAVAALAMRQVIIDYARRCQAQKRAGDRPLHSLEGSRIAVEAQAEALLEIDKALERLRRIDERLIRVVECRFFAGLTAEETAEALGVSTRTVERDWKRARAWLRHDLEAEPDEGPEPGDDAA
jgi:RNA polymerase sigma factor (TIGR02999 family)